MDNKTKEILKVIKDNFKMAQLNIETKTYVLVLTEFTAFIPASCINCKVDELIVNSTVSPNNGRMYVRIMKQCNAVISWEL